MSQENDLISPWRLLHVAKNRLPLAQRLLRELCEQYPDSELYASEYAKASSAPVRAVPAR